MKNANEMTREDLERIEKAHEKKSNPTQEDNEFLERARKAVEQNENN